MISVIADENFNGKILKGLIARLPELDIVRVQDTRLYGAPDPDVLEWAAQVERIVLTHDVQTMVNDAYARVRDGLSMPGVIHVSSNATIGNAIDDLEVLIGAGEAKDFINQVKHIPLR